MRPGKIGGLFPRHTSPGRLAQDSADVGGFKGRVPRSPISLIMVDRSVFICKLKAHSWPFRNI